MTHRWLSIGALVTAGVLADHGVLAAHGDNPAAFDGRCIPADCVAPRSTTAGIFLRHAWYWPSAASITTRLGATQDVHHGLLGASAQVGQSGSTVSLNVHVGGFDNADGAAGIAVWNAARGFPEEIEHALAATYATIQDGVAVAGFGQLEPGSYAITVYHDKNDNRRFDKNWLGMPKEAWGVSNNVRPRLRAPRFAEAMLDLDVGEQLVEIRVD